MRRRIHSFDTYPRFYLINQSIYLMWSSLSLSKMIIIIILMMIIIII